MSVYVVSMIRVDDPETYKEYTSRTPPTVKEYGGRFLARGGTVDTVEGEPFKDRLVILEFPSKEAVDAWISSPEYQEARKYRKGGTSLNNSIDLIASTVIKTLYAKVSSP